MTVRIGIVGSGFAASLYAQGLRQVPDAKIVAAASPNAEHAWVFARSFGIPHTFVDYKDMLRGDLIDAIAIACPNDLHYEVTQTAAAAGKHVLVNKPMALNLTQCDSMIRACREAGVILMYGENLCFAPRYVRAKQLADEGALGDVYYVRQLESHEGPHSGWHSIAYCRWVFGDAKVESVSAELGRFVHGKRTKGEDHSLVTMRFAGGGIGVAENSWARAGGHDDRAEIYGSKGLTVADMARGSALSTYSEPGYGYAIEQGLGTKGWTWTALEEAWSDGYVQEMAHFVECVREGAKPALGGEDGRAVLEIICAAYKSARTGQRVRLPFQADIRRPIDLWLER